MISKPERLKIDGAKAPEWARVFIDDMMRNPARLIDEKYIAEWFAGAMILGIEQGMDLMLENRKTPG